MHESKMLKVTGILMIIGGLFALGLCFVGFQSGVFSGAGLTAILAVAGGIVELAAGIMGVKNWNNPAGAQTCFILGILLIAISLINNIMGIASTGFSGSVVSNIIIGLIIPILYTYGAAQLKKGA